MARIKIEKSKKNEPVFKLKLSDDEIQKYRFLKRALMESKIIKGRFNYQVPMRFFEVIFNNLPKEQLEIDKNSVEYYLEFSDDYDDVYHFKIGINSNFMKNWRKEGCPDIYKVSINKESKQMLKELAFKKVAKMKL